QKRIAAHRGGEETKRIRSRTGVRRTKREPQDRTLRRRDLLCRIDQSKRGGIGKRIVRKRDRIGPIGMKRHIDRIARTYANKMKWNDRIERHGNARHGIIENGEEHCIGKLETNGIGVRSERIDRHGDGNDSTRKRRKDRSDRMEHIPVIAPSNKRDRIVTEVRYRIEIGQDGIVTYGPKIFTFHTFRETPKGVSQNDHGIAALIEELRKQIVSSVG